LAIYTTMERIMTFDDFVNEKVEGSLLDPTHTSKTPSKDGELLFKMEKPRSPLHVEFRLDIEEDDWVIIKYKNKQGVEKRHHTIIMKDLLKFKKSLEREGYTGPADAEVTKMMGADANPPV